MISIDILFDELSPAELDKAYRWLVKVRPPFAAVFAGARFEQAQGYAAGIARNLGIRVILRNSGARGGNPDIATDDGIHTRMTPAEWVDRHCLPLKDTGCIIACDNESQRDDMSIYAHWQARALDLAGEAGIGLAVGKQATGNPAEHQYAQMDALWHGLHKWRALSVYSPHEYHAQTPQLSGGHVNRYMLAWERCKQIGIAPPVTVIGEYGYLCSDGSRLDPEHGFRRDGISGRDAANMDIAYHRDWYARPPLNAAGQAGVTVCAYAFCGNSGKWRDMNVNDDGWLDTIAAYNATLRLPVPTPPIIDPPIPPEPPPAQSRYVTIERAEHIRLMQREKDYAALRGIMDAMIEQYEQHKEGE